MVKAFSDEERARSREALLAEARQLFITGGLAAISLSRITDAAGISKSAFYSFYPTKEDLILDLLEAEAPGVSKRVMRPLKDQSLAPSTAISEFLSAMLEEYVSNPFLARLIAEPETLVRISERVRPEDLSNKAAWMERPLAEFFQAKLKSKEIIKLPQQTLLDIVRAVGLLSLHRDRFESDQRFNAVSKAIISFVCEGLVGKEVKR